MNRRTRAAVTLVSDATAWRVGRGSIAWAVVHIGGYGDDSKTLTVHASTPALALCAAAFKALAHEAPTTKDRDDD